MSDRKKFADRYWKLKQTMQGLAEMELAKSQQEQALAVEELANTRTRKLQALALRDACKNGLEWRLWQDYFRALELTEQSQQQRLAATNQKVETKKKDVVRAYREVLKWETYVDIQRNLLMEEAAAKQQRELDEHAARKYFSSYN